MLICQLLETPRRKRSQAIPQEPRDHVVIYNGFSLQPQLLTRAEAKRMATRDSDLAMHMRNTKLILTWEETFTRWHWPQVS